MGTQGSKFESVRDVAQDAAGTRAIDAKQITHLIATQYPGLANLIRRKLRDRELAEDLLNEAVAITLEHLRANRVAESEQIGGYIFKVCMNVLRNHKRNLDNRSDVRSNSEALDLLAAEGSDETDLKLRKLTISIIESLPSQRDREVIKRFYLDEEEKESICSALDLTPLQFTQITSRARQRMKSIFEAQGYKSSDFLSILL